MSLRTRLTLAAGGAVFVALAIASLVIFAEVRSKLHDQVDVSLIQSADGMAVKAHGLALKSQSSTARAFGKDAAGLFQVIPHVGAAANGGLSLTGAPVPTTVPSSTLASPAVRQIVAHDRSVAQGLRPRTSGTFAWSELRGGCTRCDCLLRVTGSCGRCVR